MQNKLLLTIVKCLIQALSLPCCMSSREVVNSNFSRFLIWLDEGIEPRSTDYKATLKLRAG